MEFPGVMTESAAGQSAKLPSRVIYAAHRRRRRNRRGIRDDVFRIGGWTEESAGRPFDPLMRAEKLIAVGAVPPAGVSIFCGIASSTLLPSLEKPLARAAPPLSWVVTPAGVTE